MLRLSIAIFEEAMLDKNLWVNGNQAKYQQRPLSQSSIMLNHEADVFGLTTEMNMLVERIYFVILKVFAYITFKTNNNLKDIVISM